MKPRAARIALLLGGLTLGLPAPGHAQTATANLGVGATVVQTCSISTAAVAFGAYDPVITHASAPLDGTGAVVVTCVPGMGTRIDLDRGSHAQGQTRRMTGGGDLLTYELYRNATRTSVWRTGPGASGGLPIAPAPSIVARTVTVFGRIPAGQDVPAGPYTDTIVATINF
jgi:spore coat protein U-like protein